VEYVGIDWSCRRAAWCALSERGTIVGEGAVPADEDGLARLVIERLLAARPVVLVMSGAISVRDTLAAAGWQVQVAHVRKVRDVASLACKTDKVDARVLAELCRRDLVPELHVAGERDEPERGQHGGDPDQQRQAGRDERAEGDGEDDQRDGPGSSPPCRGRRR